MGIEVIREEEISLSFILSDSNVGVANSLRRSILSEVPSLAIEAVELYDNTSSLYDEILTHRLSLVPIVTDLKLFNFKDECKCEEGCPSCELELSLKKKGPGSVYSHDIKSSNKKLSPVKGILIAKLGESQNIDLKAIASLGRAKDHARWQSAVVGYKYYPIIEISEGCSQCGECVDACPRNVFEMKKGKLKIINERECIHCRACTETCDTGSIKISGNESKFIYELEATGSLKPREIITSALDILSDKADELSSKI